VVRLLGRLILYYDSRACQLGAGAAASLGERDAAMEYARRALTINPDDPLLLYSIACMHAMLGILTRR
jgi:adenylate cyclase